MEDIKFRDIFKVSQMIKKEINESKLYTNHVLLLNKRKYQLENENNTNIVSYLKEQIKSLEYNISTFRVEIIDTF